jgi:3-oxoacyl-[acyl-carrier protein] reductase
MVEDRVALITGASRGIGRAVALALSDIGIKICVNYANETQKANEVVMEICRGGGQAIAIRADVSKSNQVEAMVKNITDTWGRLDILVNNAGVAKDNLLIRMSEQEWEYVLDTNLKGAFLASRAALRLMIKHRWGRIINLSSVIGLHGNAGQANYAASKAGLVGFTKTLAKEMASRNITVNALAPGFITTDMVATLDNKARAQVLDRIPAKRFGTAEEVAALVAFLCGESASYITGQVIGIDGGIIL